MSAAPNGTEGRIDKGTIPGELSPEMSSLRMVGVVAPEIVSVKPLQQVLHTVAEKLSQLAHVDHATITLLDADGASLQVAAAQPQRAGTSPVGTVIHLRDCPVLQAVVEEQSVVTVANLAEHAIVRESAEFTDYATQLGIASLLVIPMVHRGQVVGTVSLGSFRPREFAENEIEAYHTVANLAATAVQNARQFDRQNEAEELRRAQHEASSALTLNQVADKTLDLLQRHLGFRKASLQWIDGNKRILLRARGFPRDNADPILQLPLEEDPLVSGIVNSQEPLILPRTEDNPHWISDRGTADVRSWIGLPLVYDDKTIAIVTLDHDEPGHYAKFADDKLALLQQLKYEAAAQLHQAYLYDAAQRQIRALEIANQVGQLLNTKLDAAEILDATASAIGQDLQLGQCLIFVPDTEQPQVHLDCRAANPELDDRPRVDLIDPDHGSTRPSPIEHVFRSGEPLLLHDLANQDRFVVPPQVAPSSGTLIAVPLRSFNRILGVVCVIHPVSGQLDAADRALVERLATDAGAAIERAKGLELLHNVGHKIIQAPEVGAVLEEIVSGAIRLTQRDSGVIYHLNERGDTVLATYSPDASEHPPPRLDNDAGITRQVFTTKKAIVIPDITQDSRVNPELLGRFKSMIAVPLPLEGRVLGVLYLNGRNTGGITDVETSLLSTLASQGAVAIEKARLRAHYRSLVDNIPQFLFRKDRKGRFQFANKRFCESLGRPLEDIIGKTDYDFYPRKYADAYREADQKVIDEKRTLEWEEENWPPGASEPMWVHVMKTPILDGQGQVTEVQAIFWDITEQKKTADRYRWLVEQSPDAIVVQQSNRITLANPAALQLFGVESKEKLNDRSILDFVHPDFRQLAEARLEAPDTDVATESATEMKIHPDEGPDVDVAMWRRRSGNWNERQVVFHDLTQPKTMVREMHHRVRRTLNEIWAFLSLQEKDTTEPAALEAFSAVRDRILALAKVHEFLTRAGAKPLVDMDGYLSALTQAVIRAHGGDPRGIHCDCRAAGIDLDETRATACGLIVNELVTNSLLHAFPEGGGHIDVALTAEDPDSYLLTVSDNGTGMADIEEGGQSMGLTLVERLVRDGLKGERSMTCSRGVCFSVRFPRNAQQRKQ